MTGETPNRHFLEIPMKAIASVLLLGALTTLPLAAQSANTSVDVRYADLNLTHPAGAQALYGRLKSAARQLCAYDFTPSDLYRRVARKDCYDRTLEDAVEDVNDTRLKGLHAANARPSAIG